MAKTAKFDREEVVNKAMNLYWQKGFHATSMRNLQDVIDMRPGSIYASFGSKEGLFKEALQNYARLSIVQIRACAAAASPLHALKQLLRQMIVDSCHQAPSDMCMLAKTVAELTEDNAELLKEARLLLAEIELVFAEVFLKAKACGELSEHVDAQALASYIQVQIMGLRTYARTTGNIERVEVLIDNLFKQGFH
ncbi:TetR/AcrR family transcriptional regulator [Shewanella gelidii]|uniref:TetR family transcriptional regulator n=1 Tax=Shewanella gelidii TaxID=1642821 RepID=A0A917JKN7_9GAMM|nr:TetR/AcrR family transcriptional regulator [Shewanella gelidii]MCL1096956.1 TetR/AcrR family transcriptional regulator [Shewanella gelidii]GGI71489.1 TetR family transcriptional regulator [Shewanella gelidii]